MAKMDKLTKKLLLFGVLGAAAVIVVSLMKQNQCFPE